MVRATDEQHQHFLNTFAARMASTKPQASRRAGPRSQATTPPPDGIELLTLEQAAAILGVTVKTLRTWWQRENLQFFKRGRVVRVLRSHLDTFVAVNMHKVGNVEGPADTLPEPASQETAHGISRQ
jgi:excisionase family DNA binding protein